MNMRMKEIHCLLPYGYVHKGEYGIPDREYFSKLHRKVHLHVYQEGIHEIVKHINFVNVISLNINVVSDLISLKNRLHEKYPNDKECYQNEKVHFYNEIHKKL